MDSSADVHCTTQVRAATKRATTTTTAIAIDNPSADVHYSGHPLH